MSVVFRERLGAALLVLTVAATLGLAPGHADAARRGGQAKVLKNRIKFDKGWGETVRERERRLARECRDRPNAGACLGFGR